MVRTMVTIVVLLSIYGLPIDRVDAKTGNSGNERPTIALVNRVVEIVQRKSTELDWKEAKIGDLLNSGDVIRTGPASFSLVRFYDNSLLRIRELSEVTVYADRDRESYHRNIHVDEGSVSFDVRKKESDRFEFSTPTSVASIRGSTGVFIVTLNEPDVLLMVTGLAFLINQITGEEIEIAGGEIGFSYHDGRLEKREITNDDLEKYGGVNGEVDSSPERQRRTIEIDVIGEDGTLHTIVIELEEESQDR